MPHIYITPKCILYKLKTNEMFVWIQGQGQALDLLKALQSADITLEVLQKTRIGMTVNNLRKAINEDDVTSLSKSLIKQWKKLLSTDKETRNEPDRPNANNNNNSIDAQKNNANKGPPMSRQNSSSSTSSNKSSAAQLALKQTSFPADTANSVRLKCREMLAAALKPDESYDNEETFHDPEDLAAKIEDSIYKEFKETNMKYKNRIRSRVSNLKDAKNPDLKLNVLRGTIKPEKIAVMTAEVIIFFFLLIVI